MFNFKTCGNITRAYYEHWIGEEGCLASEKKLSVIYSEERNNRQIGYPNPMDLYIWVQGDKRIVSYGEAAKPKIEAVVNRVEAAQNIAELIMTLSELYGCQVGHQVKYKFESHQQVNTTRAVTLTSKDYSDYETFFRTRHPGVKEIDWLREYFNEMVENGYCIAIYEDARIVCCSDAPDMPYLSHQVQEIGVNTLGGYEGRGYATAVCSKAVEAIVSSHKVPQWSTTITNMASQKVAQRIGFVKLSDVLTMTLE